MELWFIPLLYALCFAGLAMIAGDAINDGMDSYAQVYATETARQFEDVFLFIPAARLLALARMAALTMFFLCFMVFGGFAEYRDMLRGGLFGALAAVAALNAPRVILRILKARRLDRFNLQLVDSLLGMSNALKAGFSILQAFETVVREGRSPIAQEFGVFLHQIRLGVRFEEAMRQMDQRVGSEDLTLMILAIETARQTGGNLTEVFEKIASTVRERMRIQGRVKSLTAQGRLQGIIVGSMPILLLIAMSWIDPVMMQGFFHDKIGWALLGLVGVLETAGALVIRKIIRIEV